MPNTHNYRYRRAYWFSGTEDKKKYLNSLYKLEKSLNPMPSSGRQKVFYAPKSRSNSKIAKLERKVQKIERGGNKELKTFDFSYNTDPLSTGAIALITGIAQGDTSITREGLQIRPKSLELRLLLTANNSGTEYARMIIFRDTQQAGTAPTVAQLLEEDTVLGFPEHDTRPRFKILRDKTFKLDNGNINGHIRKYFISLPKTSRIYYSGTTGSAISMGKNNLYVYWVSTTSADHPSLSSRFRLRFTE